jgi:hypothetical protein
MFRAQKTARKPQKTPLLARPLARWLLPCNSCCFIVSFAVVAFHLRLGLLSDLFLSDFLQKIVSAPLRSRLGYMSCSSHLPWLNILIIFGEVYKLWSFSLCDFLKPPVISNFLGPNILFSILFSNTLRLCTSLNVTDQVSNPYKLHGKL